jgi:hypothetical protein
MSQDAEDAEARHHIRAVAGRQAAARGGIEFVSTPKVRRLARRAQARWAGFTELLGAVRRRFTDSHKFPGRWGTRFKLYRPSQTVTPVVLGLIVTIAVCATFLFWLLPRHWEKPLPDAFKWSLGAALSAAVGALVATLWHDLFKSPCSVKKIRHRIAKDPAALLRLTLAKETMKVMELQPPLETVPRERLYDELLPGVLSRTKDIQIVVGDPGAGKTTALVELAAILAKVGLVPVLLQLRGECDGGDLFEMAKLRFLTQVRPLVTTAADAELVWRWLCRRQRLVFLVDDLDQIGFDGEPGFLMRRLLEDLAPEGQPVIVTARPSGVPVGIAASAIAIEPLAFDTAVEIVARPKAREPGATTTDRPSHRRIVGWVRGGDLEHAPLYLEALAEMTSAGVLPDLPDDPSRWENRERPGRCRQLGGSYEWNPVWVRYFLLQRFCNRIADGRVRPSLAIDTQDRKRCVHALEGAALGVLAATGLEARAAAIAPDEPKATRRGRPKRIDLVEFISTDDRPLDSERSVSSPGPRPRVSPHEAIDTGERLRILDRDQGGDPQFRHRIMQAFFAGRRLAEIGRCEEPCRRRLSLFNRGGGERIVSFDRWVKILMDHHHPEQLTAHLALTFAAIHADACAAMKPGVGWDGLAEEIARLLIAAVDGARADHPRRLGDCGVDLATQPDPMSCPDPYERADPDDNLVKLTTAANIAKLLALPGEAGRQSGLVKGIVDRLDATEGAMRWTKQQAIPAIAALETETSWDTIWKRFARDPDYAVRRCAGQQLERNAHPAFHHLGKSIEKTILKAGYRASKGLPLIEASEPDWPDERVRSLEALGWVLPAIVSGLSEERRGAGEPADGESDSSCVYEARTRLSELVTLAFEGGRAKLEDAVAQGFKADAMRHSSDPASVKGPGWVAGNRRLVADVGLPHAESWYARMLLYQAMSLYAIAGADREDTFDVLAYRLHATRERHPLARQAAKLSRSALRRAGSRKERWKAFVWSDEIEDTGSLPAVLGGRAAQLVGDVTVLVDLKEGSSGDHHQRFGYMEELPYCLSSSRDRHEILGGGCPDRCGWGFCPYRVAAPEEPDGHRGVSRSFCRAQRRLFFRRRAAWQRKVRKRDLREFWQQMEYKARR